ncbi:hypothetical protein KW797_02030 [Candidatus Parcubacteria bacterium]|nr:hypothetical protein [Candidatus Parcubacteria bacterium]
MMKLGKKRNSLIFLSALAALSVAAYSLFFYYIRGNNERAATIGQEIALADEREGAAHSVKDLLTQTEANRAEFDAYFVSQNSIVGFIERLEALGAKAGVTMELSAVDTEQGRKNVLKANIRMAGTFENLYYLLSLLEALPYELDVVRFSVSAAPAALQKDRAPWEGDASIELLNFLP